MMRVDEGFVRRTMITISWFTAVVLITVAGWGHDWPVYAAVALGAALMAAAIWVLSLAVGAATREHNPRRGWITAAFLLKPPIVGSIFYLVTQHTALSGVALAGGLGLPIAVILLKLAGQAMTKPSKVPRATAGQDTESRDGRS